MLPTRLELRNFLAYRAPAPIVFAGIDLACLTGGNGVGKSSLFDAMTWALWGKARAKRDDDLIHLGAEQMMVSLEFEQDGRRYRVQRRRARAGRGRRGALEFMLWGAHDQQPRRITADGMRKTQEKINAVLRLDYETFLHSAYVQQGRADAFALATAAERKRLLAEILNLRQWAGYEAAVKERRSRLAGQIDMLERDISRFQQEIAGEPQLRADLEAASATLRRSEDSLQQANERYQEVAHAAAALLRERETLDATAARIKSRQEDAAAAQAEITRQDSKIAEYQRAIAGGADIESGYQQLQQARHSQSALAAQWSRIQELDQRQNALERDLAAKRSDLAREADVLRERVTALAARQAAAEADDIAELRRQLARLEALHSQREALNTALEAEARQQTEARARLKNLTAAGKAINDRLQRLAQADGANCPLCGAALTAEHRDATLAQLHAEREQLRADYRRCQRQSRERESARQEQEQEREALVQPLKDLPALQQRLGAAEQAARQAEEAAAERQRAAAALAAVEKRLTEDDFGGESRRQLRRIQEQRARIGYDAASHADISSQLESYAAFERQYSQLEFARRTLPEAQRIRQQTAARLTNAESALTREQAAHQRAAEAINALEKAVTQERERRAQVETLRAEARRHNEAKTILEQELRAIDAGRQNVERLSARLDASRHQHSLLQELGTAFGKNGLPAMLIESAIPELEAEANALLARMSENRMALRFSTQRERASGGAIETLDIEIADELGTRPYELYSGGEAFRINFAVRIALSKLLARRAGAQLRALFIDEGFGTQDADGQAKLIDAISKIAADFELVLVITHIDSLRDAFPVHLLVEKTPEGSIVRAE